MMRHESLLRADRRPLSCCKQGNPAWNANQWRPVVPKPRSSLLATGELRTAFIPSFCPISVA